ncbi:WD40-repeat-containing domain protein [Suillus plorans]|uniref:WD40-repeat-containing domain protein n=1 Tax=Suillus plorans TaxID=116603 RepID=A0A9P7ABN6_9AGAM|nr:WD40-repeat-containing domain protein [Suillus plorans]KAG1785217.1 WD40-repeat-containing domain protein [Suillus plorans]
MVQLIPNTTAVRVFEDHTDNINAVAALPDGRRMITASKDNTLCLWDLESGEVLKKMEGHRGALNALAVSPDGKLIASGDTRGELIASHGETGETLTRPIKVHSATILSIDFSPDGAALATGLDDGTTKFVSTRTWRVQGNPIKSSCLVRCVRYSPSGTLLGIATREKIEIYKSGKRQCVAKFKGHRKTNFSLAWTPDGTRLLTGGDHQDPTIREWDISTWKQVGEPWIGHATVIKAIVVNSAGTLVASASYDNHVRLWRLSDQRTIASFQHCALVISVTFSIDGSRILSGGVDKKVSEWAVPEDALPDDNPNGLAPKAPGSDSEDGPKDLAPKDQGSDSKTVVAIQTVVTVQTNVITKTARNTRVTEVLSTAEMVLTETFDAGINNYASYANRSFVMARKSDWDCALQDAIKSLTIHPSLAGYIAQGIALCGKQLVEDARAAFELAFTFTVGNSDATLFLFLIKAIALFNANEHSEAMLCVEQLATDSNADPLVCRVVEASLRVQLGTIAFNGAHHNEAVEHFTAAVKASTFLAKSATPSACKAFTVLFGWELESLWQTANEKLCFALLKAGRLGEALESYKYGMDASDEATRSGLRAWIFTISL